MKRSINTWQAVEEIHKAIAHLIDVVSIDIEFSMDFITSDNNKHQLSCTVFYMKEKVKKNFTEYVYSSMRPLTLGWLKAAVVQEVERITAKEPTDFRIDK